MTRSVILSFFVALSCGVCSFGQTAVGTLQGTVTDAQGTPLPGAQVRYQRVFQTVRADNGQPVPAPGEAVVFSTATADSNGAFTAPSLPSGDYLLCASVPSAPYLDPCLWAGALRVTVPANASAEQNIALAEGVFLNVRVNDPSGLLPQSPSGPLRASKLVVGIRYANGAFQGLPNTETDSAGRSYQMTIPIGTPLKLWLFSGDVSLSDANGNPVAVGSQAPFEAVASQDQTFTFAVTELATKAL